jgi:hypothetical protein
VSTHDALIDMAEDRFGDTSNNVVTAATWSTYLNTAYQFANGRTPLWPWLEAQSTSVTVTAGSRSAALPADTFQVHSVYNLTNDFPLVPLADRRQQQDSWVLGSTERGTPSHYRLRNATIELFPLAEANTNLQIEYVANVADLATTAEPAWPEQFHRILVTGMLALAYQDDGNLKQYEQRWAHFNAEVDNMLRSVLAFRSEQNYPIVDDWYR